MQHFLASDAAGAKHSFVREDLKYFFNTLGYKQKYTLLSGSARYTPNSRHIRMGANRIITVPHGHTRIVTSSRATSIGVKMPPVGERVRGGDFLWKFAKPILRDTRFVGLFPVGLTNTASVVS